ncbi:MAG: NAD kinase [Tannerellaceae bacterium]|nr:NAD kinase [Tannerellaceae bacterium]
MRVGIFGSRHQEDKLNIIKRLFEKLHALEAGIYVDKSFYDFLTGELNYHPPVADLITGDLYQLDVVLSIGGDGTFLRTAAWVNDQNIPILGVNTGRLGFLADVSSNQIEDTLDELFKNYYRVEERSLLRLHTDERLYKGHNYALNEVTISKRDTSSMLTIHTWVDEEYLTSYEADGLIISTPTGSTAYSLSVNGPILIPQSNNIILSPVAPHSLNVRPLVIPDSAVIKLEVESCSKHFLVSLDGRSEVFPLGHRIRVDKASYTTKVIKRYNHTFYQTLRDKLSWGTDPRMKM